MNNLTDLDGRPASSPIDLAEAGFPAISGVDYFSFLKKLHRLAKPDWYLEVGTQAGYSLSRCLGKAIAIDPEFKIADTTLLTNPLIHFFEMTSDDAFADPGFQALKARIDIAFLDGLHLFEFLLRDFINAEKRMAPGGIILMHDTAPYGLAMTDRFNPEDGIAWTGDVWKILPILARYRPDLQIWHLDLQPTGMSVVVGDWGKNPALEANYEAIVQEWAAQTLGTYGVVRYFSEFPLISGKDWLISLALCGLSTAEVEGVNA